MSNEETYTKIPTKLFQANLSSLQFRFLCNFIRISGINNGHSFFGYPNLAQINQCGRAAAIKTVQELEKLGFIQVVDRGNRSRSNDILLTLEKGFSRSTNGGSKTSKEGYLKDTPQPCEGYLKDTRGYLKDTRGYLKDTPHKDIKDLNNIYLNNNTGEEYLNNTPKQETEGKKNIATGDVAPVRFNANNESAINGVVETQVELEDFLLVDRFKEEFKDILPVITLIKAKNKYAIRPFLARSVSDLRTCDLYEFFRKEGKKFDFLKKNEHLQGEIIINL